MCGVVKEILKYDPISNSIHDGWWGKFSTVSENSLLYLVSLRFGISQNKVYNFCLLEVNRLLSSTKLNKTQIKVWFSEQVGRFQILLARLIVAV